MADEKIYKPKQHSLELDTIENTCDVMNGNSSGETTENVLDKSKETLQYNELKEMLDISVFLIIQIDNL